MRTPRQSLWQKRGVVLRLSSQWTCARRGRKRVKLADGQAYRFHCRKLVNMVEVSTARITSRYLEVVTGECPKCETTVARGRARRDQL